MLLVLHGLLAGLSLAELHALQKKSISERKSKAAKFAANLSEEEREAFETKQREIEAAQESAGPALLVKHAGQEAGIVSASGKISLAQEDIDRAKKADVQVLDTPPLPPPQPRLPFVAGGGRRELPPDLAAAHRTHAKSVFSDIVNFDASKLKKVSSSTPPVAGEAILEEVESRGIAPEGLAEELNDRLPETQKSLRHAIAQALAAQRLQIEPSKGE